MAIVSVKIRVRLMCPDCASASHIRRSQRKTWERMFSLVALPCRCENCGCRFFTWRWRVAALEQFLSRRRVSAGRQPQRAAANHHNSE